MLLYKDEFLNTKNKNTFQTYNSALVHFEKYLCDMYGRDIDEKKISVLFMKNYREYLDKTIKTKTTIARNIYAIRSYFKYLIKKGYIENNPSTILESPKIDRKSPVIIDKCDLEKLLNIKLNSIENYRLHAIIMILYYTGIKVSELVNLKIHEMQDNKLKVKNESGNVREIPLNDVTLKSINKYLNERQNIDSPYFLHSKKGDILNRKSLWRILQEHVKEKGITKKINSEVFRENYIINKLTELQRQLGYDSFGSLMNYIRETVDYQKTTGPKPKNISAI